MIRNDRPIAIARVCCAAVAVVAAVAAAGTGCSGPVEPLEDAARKSEATTTCDDPKPVTYKLEVTAKSYIAPFYDWGDPPPNSFFENFITAALATQAAYHEDPSELKKSCDGISFNPIGTTDTCRLMVVTELTVVCKGTTMVSITAGGTWAKVGLEGPLRGVLKTFGATAQVVNGPAPGTNHGEFRVLVAGHPNPIAEALFTSVKKRTNVDIWNHSQGVVKCTNGGLLATASAIGTGFPSHRVWVSSVGGPKRKLLAFNQVYQGDFNLLWSLAPVPPL